MFYRGTHDARHSQSTAFGVSRLTRVAGFEWGTGFYINPVPPEQSAQFLHDTEVDPAAAPKR